MDITIGLWNKGLSAGCLDEIAALWNTNAAGRHGFFPWSGKLLAQLLPDEIGFTGLLLEARADGRLIGFCAGGSLHEPEYAFSATIEALLVDRAWRGQGVGTTLLRSAVRLLRRRWPRPLFIDAMGSWPNGYAFSTLADGSERSGVLATDKDLYRLFRREGFAVVRKSLILRAANTNPLAAPQPIPKNTMVYIRRRGRDTWLDRAFRGRTLWNHELTRGGKTISRAIFGLLDDVSRAEGKIVFSLFGVNTAPQHRRKGLGRINISNLMAYTAKLGCEMTEVHVYADNEAALALYRALGFSPVGETIMLQLPLDTEMQNI